METKLHINPIENRQYVLSPAIQSGNDRECINKDFYQEGDNSYVYVGKLGLGMKVVHRKTTIPYTIIHFEKEKVSKLKLQKKINSTLDLMYKSSHPYMFRLLNHYETQTHVFMIFEEYDGDSLDNKILNGKCDLQNSLKYLVEVMLGVQHMHSFNLYNLNVNPENILVTECIKLTDYGLKMEGKNEKPKRVTIIKKKENINYVINAYTSPEELEAILNGKPCIINGKTDSWNCGILLYEMLTSFQSPFKGNTNEEIIDAILNCKIDLSPIKDEFCRDLISKLVRKNPKDRISIDDVLNMDYIKNVDIEQPEIDFSDNIINPIDEQEFLKNMNETPNGNNNQSNKISSNQTQEYQKTMLHLKNENDSLKKIVEDLRKQVVSSSNKKKGKKHVSKLKSMVIDAGGEFATDENEAQNLGEILGDENTPNKGEEKDKKEHKIEEIKRGVKNEIIEEEDEDDDDEEFSEKEEEYEDDNLFVRCEKYKERNIQLKEKLSKMYKKNKTMKSLLDQYKKENDTLKSEKNKNILETLSKMNTVPIYEINDLVNVIMNSINIFKTSANDFKKSMDKLIKVSDEKYNNLSEENKKYIDVKTKLFFDIMNNKITDVEAYNKLNSVNVEEKPKKNENNVRNNNNISKNEDYSKKYDEWKKREGELLQKIRESEEKYKSKNELYTAEKKNYEEFQIQFKDIANKWQNSEKNIQDLKEFINEKVDKNEAKKFFERIKI